MTQTQLDTSKLTPMMRQFFDLKAQAQDSILFFRMGDFYEIFGDDAEDVAPRLELVLTSRERGDKNKIPFCGVPHHSARNYWLKLLKMGYRVAVADQVENPEDAKGLVKRDIVQVFTPGCIEDLEGLESDSPNFLMGIYESPEKRIWVLALVDVSTGEFRLGNLSSLEDVVSYVQRFRPKELVARRFIIEELNTLLQDYIAERGLSIAPMPEGILRDSEKQLELVDEKFSVKSLKDLPCGPVESGSTLVAGVLTYLSSIHATTDQFLSIKPLQEAKTMILDETALRDLELFETVRRRQSQGSLFREINRTRTPMGARLLRNSLIAPFIDENNIKSRQDHVAGMLSGERDFLQEFRDRLKGTPDLERLTTRVLSKKAHPLELASIRNTLSICLEIKDHLKTQDELSKVLSHHLEVFETALEPLQLLVRSIKEEPSPLGSLNVIADNFDGKFDELRCLSENGQQAIRDYEQSLKESTGINSIKIKSHKTFGLLIEVTKANLNKVPESFIRRQTMVNNERFVTEELVELGDQLSHAKDEALIREQELYEGLLGELASYRERFKAISEALAYTDLVQSFAWLAQEKNYCRPIVSRKGDLMLKGCRHPVVEGFVGRYDFVPNDVVMKSGCRHLLITGPNMAGKSTVMRQTAIAAILHQIGSFVPAVSAKLPIFDRVFTRVGAADDLSRGQSTFMVEMSEAAAILREASHNSLVILDEVGRGTSTEDGKAIASAILECLANDLSCYSLFATHYHELVPLAESLNSVRNVQVEVREDADHVDFTHRLIDGASGSSFGIEVAKLAGVPEKVIERAKKYLSLEQNQLASEIRSKEPKPKKQAKEPQLPLEKKGLDAGVSKLSLNDVENKVIARLRGLNLNKMTPIQALSLLDQLQTQIEECKQKDIFVDLTH